MFCFHKKYLLISILLVLDIFLLTDIGKNQKLKIKSQILGNTTSVVKNERTNVKSSVAVRRITPTPTKEPRTDLDTSLTKDGPSPSPASLQIIPTSTPYASGNTNSEFLRQINDFRTSKGKAPLSEEPTACSFATTRAVEIVSSFNHDGFRNRIDSKTLPYSSYSSVAENIAMNSDSNQVVPNWINSPGHEENMLKDIPYGCVESSGIYYVYEAWKP